MKKINISCKILGRDFINPIWLGSGSLADNNEKILRFLKSSVGAIVPRTTRLAYAEGREKHPSYHLDINFKERWIRNCEWTGNVIEYWVPYLEELSRNKKTIMSVSGRDIKGCLETCKILDSFNFPFLEINISCSHSNEVHGFITRNKEHITKLVTVLKKNVKTPIALKLGHSDFIVELAQEAEKAGADAIVVINTVGPVLDFDISSGEPQLTLGISSGKGGLSGKTIFQIALTDVSEISRALTIPVIACGGISTAEDAVKMIMAGASAVQIYSAAHLAGVQAPKFFDRVVEDFEKWLEEHGYDNVSQIKGILLPKLLRANQMNKIVPYWDRISCIKCGKCKNICLENAIDIVEKEVKITKKCIGCGACVSTCPTKSLK